MYIKTKKIFLKNPQRVTSFVASEINKYSIYTKNLTILYYIFIATKYAPKTNENINLNTFQFIKALKIYHSWLITSRPRCKPHASVPVKFNDFKNIFFKKTRLSVC